MKIFFSIVSHKHEKLIKSLQSIPVLLEFGNVIIKSNVCEDFSSIVHENFTHINSAFYKGFGENNNIIFDYCLNNLELKDDDLFIVINPDVYIDSENINKIITEFKNDNKLQLGCIDLYKDSLYRKSDNSIRKFPTLCSFIFAFFGKNNKIVDKSNIDNKELVDWAAGSFLIFRASLYKLLEGFDKRYFMYCEDIDICFRAKKIGKGLRYLSNIKAIHLAKHANRKIFSKHFYWHVKSSMLFILLKRFTR